MNEIADRHASLRRYLAAEKAPATRRGYASDLADFAAWCTAVGVPPLPADPLDVARYLAHLADRGAKAGTIARRVSAIRSAHVAAGHASPTGTEGVRATMRGIRRTIGVRPDRKAPATAEAIAAMVGQCPGTVTGKRDRALLLLGFAGAFRRSELVALTVSDLEREPEGLRVHIRRSKTDQAGSGHVVAIPRGSRLHVIEAVDAWLAAAAITAGPIFRAVNRRGTVGSAGLSDHSVANIVKQYAKAAGFDVAAFSGHSLRTGFVTSALEHGADILKVMDQTRHKDIKTLKIYDRRAKAFRDHAGKDFL